MPPVRRRGAGPQQRQVAANYANQPSIQDLQQQCFEKGLSDHGRRNSLIRKLLEPFSD